MIIINVKELRTARGLSIRKLAEMSGVSKTHISEIERGNKSPTIYVLYLLSKALEVSIEDTYGINDNK